MKKIIPFNKEIAFKTNLSEIVSISLEHSLHQVGEYSVTGDFVVSGEYKMADVSVNTEKFSYNLPFDINIDEHYDTSNIVVDIDDFYYEIINNNALKVDIDVALDGLKEKPIVLVEDLEEKIVLNNIADEAELITRNEKEIVLLDDAEEDDRVVIPIPVEIDSKIVPLEVTVDEKENIQEMKSLFDSLDESTETYKNYKVYIVRENDTIETITQKYEITREHLEIYNDLKEIKYGDKLVIPYIYDKN